MIDDTGFNYVYDPNIELNADSNCDTQANSIKYDDYQQNYGGSDISITANSSGPICCRGMINYSSNETRFESDLMMKRC